MLTHELKVNAIHSTKQSRKQTGKFSSTVLNWQGLQPDITTGSYQEDFWCPSTQQNLRAQPSLHTVRESTSLSSTQPLVLHFTCRYWPCLLLSNVAKIDKYVKKWQVRACRNKCADARESQNRGTNSKQGVIPLISFPFQYSYFIQWGLITMVVILKGQTWILCYTLKIRIVDVLIFHEKMSMFSVGLK